MISMGLTNALQVHMDPKLDIVYSRGRSKSMELSRWMICNFNDKRGLEYVLPGTRTPKPSSRATQGTPQKVACGIVTAS